MKKPISTKMHGVLDYLTAGTMLTLPSLLGVNTKLARAVQMVGAGKLLYAMMTDHELGLVRQIPMKTHLALDVIGGATLCALPFILGDEDDPDGAYSALIGMGVFDIAAAPMTETVSTGDSLLVDARQSVQNRVGELVS